MRIVSGLGVLLALSLTMPGCDGALGSAPTAVDGAWLGEGEFRTSRGSMDVRAQLELLSDGTYRFLILEPSILMMTGAEHGTWAREGDSLTLTPGAAPAPPTDQQGDSTGSVFQQLRQGSAAADRPAKVLTVASNLRSMRFDDGQLGLTFTPNAPATKKLRETGEVVDR